MTDDRRWNHNIHYHPVVLDAMPQPCGSALDVGCGEGVLTRALARRAGSVIGIDLDRPSIELARSQPHDGVTVEYVVGDVRTHAFDPGSFDFVASIATLHHMPTAEGLTCLRDLVRPGGTLAVVGLAASSYPRDLAWDLAGAAATRWLKLSRSRTYWEHAAPVVWPPPDRYGEVRAEAQRLLPGASWRRRVLWRYTLVWTNALS